MMGKSLGVSNLFVCLGRPEYKNLVLDFLFQVARTYPQFSIEALVDFGETWSGAPENLNIECLQKENYVHARNLGSLPAINALMHQMEHRNYSFVYYIDSLVWGSWLTTVFEESRLQTISLSGFDRLSQKYRYLMDLFQCDQWAENGETKVVRKLNEIFPYSARGYKCLLVSNELLRPEDQMFSPHHSYLSVPEDLHNENPSVVESAICLWQKNKHRDNPLHLLASQLDLFEIVDNGYTNEMVSSQHIHQEYSHCLDLTKEFFCESRPTPREVIFETSSILRLRQICHKMLQSLEEENNIFFDLQGHHFDRQIANLIFESFQTKVVPEDVKTSSIQQLIHFDEFLVLKSENAGIISTNRKRRRLI